VSSLSLGNDFITLEEAKSSLYSRELRLKASENGDEVSTSILSVNDYAKRQKKKKFKVKKSKVDPKDICNYFKELVHWQWDCTKKDYVVVVVRNESSSESDLVLAFGEKLQQHYE